jgi:hypothetical protein
MSTFPEVGLSSGDYKKSIRQSDSHAGMTAPIRHDHRTGTSHASASSSKLANFGSPAVVIPLRANDRRARSWRPGRCGVGTTPAIPGVIASREPKISVRTFSASTTQFRSPWRMDENTSCTAGPLQATNAAHSHPIHRLLAHGCTEMNFQSRSIRYSKQTSMLPGTLTLLCSRELACHRGVTSI